MRLLWQPSAFRPPPWAWAVDANKAVRSNTAPLPRLLGEIEAPSSLFSSAYWQAIEDGTVFCTRTGVLTCSSSRCVFPQDWRVFVSVPKRSAIPHSQLPRSGWRNSNVTSQFVPSSLLKKNPTYRLLRLSCVNGADLLWSTRRSIAWLVLNHTFYSY